MSTLRIWNCHFLKPSFKNHQHIQKSTIIEPENQFLLTVSQKFMLFLDLWAPGVGSLCGGAQMVPDAATWWQMVPDAAICRQRIPNAARCCQPRCFQVLSDPARCSWVPPDDPRYCQRHNKCQYTCQRQPQYQHQHQYILRVFPKSHYIP